MPRNTFARNAIAVSTWAMPLGRPERVNLVPAVEHRVGKARAAKEHADHRAVVLAMPKGDQLARDRIRRKIVGPRKADQPLERRDRVAARAEVDRDEIGLAARQAPRPAARESPKCPPL